MTINTYFLLLVRAVIAASLVCASVFTFGEPALFDRLFLTTLALLLLIHSIRKDINIASILLIIFAERLCDEAAFALMYADFIKPLTYSLCGAVLYKLKHDEWLLRIAAPVYFISVVAEVYWYVTGYNPPVIHYSIALITINFVVRHYLFMRPFLLEKYFNGAKSLKLDMQLNHVALMMILAISIQLLEYVARHLSLTQSTSAYQAYPYVTQTFTIFILVLVTDYLFNRDHKLSA